MRCLVVGAGIGGVTAALALRRAGHEVELFERAPAPREVGAGIVLWGNAIAALRRIGAAEAVLAHGEPMGVGELRALDGRRLSHQDVAAWDRALGETSVVLHRAELLAALLERLEPACLHLGHELVSVHDEGRGVRATFANGAEAHGDVLVGADGLHSRVRQVLGDASPPRYSGYSCWRAVVEAPEDLVARGELCESWGRGRRFGWLRLSRGRVYWFATFDAPPGERDATPAAGLARAAELFRHGWGPIPALIAATEPARLLRNDILDRAPRLLAGRGALTLLGDAAHPTTPNIGQGACLAIEDAVVLTRALERAPLPAALRAYERARHRRARAIVAFSWRLGRVGQWSHPLACWLRDRALALTPMTAIRRQHARTVGFRA